MVCQSCIESLTALMDGELTPALRAEVEAHLADCSACRQEHASLESAYPVAAALPELEPSERVWRGIAMELQGDLGLPATTRPPFFRRLLRVLPRTWLPATAVAGLLGGFLLFQTYSAETRRLESEFATYIQVREHKSSQNRLILFDQTHYQRYQPERNPFIQPVQLDRNPFRSTPR